MISPAHTTQLRSASPVSRAARLLVTGTVTTALGAVMAFGVAGPANASPQTPSPLSGASASSSAAVTTTPMTSDPRYNDMVNGLNMINDIPDDVLKKGDKATQAWIIKNYGQSGPGVVARASVLGCTAAIATVIASTAIPAAKLLKIKSLIKALGGVKEAVKIMWGASFSYEKVRALGGAAAALAAEIIGITAIKKECFS